MASAVVASPASADAAQFGSVSTFAEVPADPGFPEGIAVHGNLVYVAGPATFGTAGKGPSKLFAFDRRTGALVRTIAVQGEALAYEHALSCIAVDDFGRVYGLSTQLGVLRFTTIGRHVIQESYGAPLPDLKPCGEAAVGEACSPTYADMPPLPNDIVFDEDGFAYVTDSFQATIWRYAPGGGAPEPWFQSPLLQGGGSFPLGANGIRLDPEREHVYVSVTFSASNPAVSEIYRIPLVDHPDPSEIELVHEYDAGEGPDGFAFGRSGKLYVALAGASAISVLSPDGSEVNRIQSPAGASVPFDNPANIAFDNRSKSLLVVNHALFSGNPAHFAVLKVAVGDVADPLDEPCLP